MSGERLDNQHCDNITFDLSGQKLLAPVVSTVDIMKFLGPDVPLLDGSLGLDIFAHRAITIIPRKAIVLESPSSLADRVKTARAFPIRIVRDVEGIALSVDGAVRTPEGLAWMELDTGNGGSLVVANHIAPLLGLPVDRTTPQAGHFELANGITVAANSHARPGHGWQHRRTISQPMGVDARSGARARLASAIIVRRMRVPGAGIAMIIIDYQLIINLKARGTTGSQSNTAAGERKVR
jgi:hypothetical protein